LDADGLSEYNPGLTIEATGIMKRYYGELLLALAERWHVHAFWYDWRKDLKISAAELHAQINRWFPEQEAVHFVTHGSGGLVARTFIHEYGERWQAEGGRGRLVMLGAPNYGSL